MPPRFQQIQPDSVQGFKNHNMSKPFVSLPSTIAMLLLLFAGDSFAISLFFSTSCRIPLSC